MITLTVPRAIPVLAAVLGLVWGGPTVVALVTGGRVNPLFAVPNILIAVGLLAFAATTARIRVVLDGDGVAARSVSGTGTASWAEVKGIALRQDGGVPKLKVVRRAGPPLTVSAWSLVARDDEGDVEPAGEALSRFGVEHGIQVRVRRMTDPMPRSER